MQNNGFTITVCLERERGVFYILAEIAGSHLICVFFLLCNKTPNLHTLWNLPEKSWYIPLNPVNNGKIPIWGEKF